MKFRNILICTLLFAGGAFLGKKVHNWQITREKELRVPLLERELIGCDEMPEKEIHLFLHMQDHEQAICRCLSTLAKQKYGRLHLYLLDENSSDQTWEKANRYAEEHELQVEQTVHGNRKKLLRFAQETIALAPEDALIISMEGKDWLPHSRVMKLVNLKMAQNGSRLLLGQLSTYPKYTLGVEKKWIKRRVDKQKWPKSDALLSAFKVVEASLLQGADLDIFTLQQEETFKPLYLAAQDHIFFSRSVYYVQNRLEPGKKLLFSEGE